MRLPASARFVRFVFRWSRPLPVADFDVRATLPDTVQQRRIRQQLGAALDLVRSHAPLRYAYLNRDLPRILVGPSHGLGECHAAVGICLLKFEYVVADATTPQELALTLVHEGTHARLDRAGVGYVGAERRARIERLCTQAELILAQRVPGGEAAAAYARQRLEWPTSMWTDEAFSDRRREALQALGWEGRLAYRVSSAFARVRKRFDGRAA